jgi:essential nuclear protein 1
VHTVKQGSNLADLILEQIAAHEAMQEGVPTAGGGRPAQATVELPPKVIDVYSK